MNLHDDAWGLPTATCPTTAALVDAIRARHSANLQQGRVMLFCFGRDKGHALGNYFLPLATASLVSLLLDLAIVIQCDDPPRRGQHQRGETAFRHFFCAPPTGLQWNVSLPRSAVISLARSTVSFSLGGNVSGAIARAPSSVRGRFLVPDSSTHLVTSDPSNRARLEGLLGPALVAAPNLYGCMLRLLIMPCARTRDALRRTLPAMATSAVPTARWPAASRQLAPVVAMHVRLGDAYIVHGPGQHRRADRRWESQQQYALLRRRHNVTRLQRPRVVHVQQHTKHTLTDREGGRRLGLMASEAQHGRRLGFMPWSTRENQFVTAPVNSMACLLHAGSSSANSECLQPAVVADTPIVEACARRVLLDNVTLTPGTAAFINVDLDGDDPGYLKAVLDWWVLATATGVITLQRSSLADTAVAFRDATAAERWTLHVRDHLNSSVRLRDTCTRLRTGETRYLHPPPPSLIERLSCSRRGLCAVVGAPLAGQHVLILSVTAVGVVGGAVLAAVRCLLVVPR